MVEDRPDKPTGKAFGKRGPKPVVTYKPKTPGVAPPVRKRSLAVSLVAAGAIMLGGYEAIDWLDRKLNCEPDPNKPDELICKHRSSSGSTYRRSSSSGWHWSSGGSSSSSSHGFSFGGFGHSGGGFHFGGG